MTTETVTTNQKSFHGPKIYPVECTGVSITDDQGKVTTTYAEDHQTIRLVYKADRTIVKRCEACQKLFAKSRGRKGANPAKALQKIMEYAKEAAAMLESDIVDQMSREDITRLEDYVAAGEEASLKLATLKAEKATN